MELSQLKPYSISTNVFSQVVTPLFNSGNVTNPDEMLKLLKSIHTSLWPKRKTTPPMAFAGATAGYFQELLDGYRHAVVCGRKVQFGSIAGIGGDTVYEVFVARLNATVKVTSQFKTTSSHAGAVREHICKAAWQLTGAGGETPAGGSFRKIEVIVQDGTQVEPRTVTEVGDFDKDKWIAEIREALAEGYSKQKPEKTANDLYLATDAVFITTKKARFRFGIPNSADQPITFHGSEAPNKQFGYTFSSGTMERHWRWLTNTYMEEAKKKNKYNWNSISTHGLGTGRDDTPSKLPTWAGP